MAKAKLPPPPSPRNQTAKRRIVDLLGNGPRSARDISSTCGMAEKEVYTHLEHIRRSLHRESCRLVVLPPPV